MDFCSAPTMGSSSCCSSRGEQYPIFLGTGYLSIFGTGTWYPYLGTEYRAFFCGHMGPLIAKWGAVLESWALNILAIVLGIANKAHVTCKLGKIRLY